MRRFISTILIVPFSLLNAFLLSPWGLIVPLTLIALLVGFRLVEKTPPQLADYYAAQFAACDDADIPQILNSLFRLGDAGVDGLVQGLKSERETVFNACRNVLDDRLLEEQDAGALRRFEELLSAALSKHCAAFRPIGQYEAVRMTEQILNHRKDSKAETTRNCEQVLTLLQGTRRNRLEPNRPGETAPQSATVASVKRRAVQPALLASNGHRFVPETQMLAKNAEAGNTNSLQLADTHFDSLSVPRAERIAAFQRSGRARDSWNPSPETAAAALALTVPEAGLSNMPQRSPANVEPRIARNYQPKTPSQSNQENQSPEISSEYINERDSGIQPDSRRMDNLLPQELKETPIDRVPKLPTPQLMRLLHHPDPNYVFEARKTLTEREGFQDSHLKLAWRLYHPVASVRQEILTILPRTANAQPAAWLSVLLDDPNNEVRYQAASFLATTSDPSLQRMLVEHGKRDTDERIVELADRIASGGTSTKVNSGTSGVAGAQRGNVRR
ncbi:hypothetical protein FACS189454_05490 [Planctomycetales bacterium]|nr:hypothetical protein FACS189454_05490 [Planctomycetales bacterium]